MKRIAITGAPKSGKTRYATRLAKSLGVEAVHTDDFIDLGWSEASERAAEVMAQPETVLTEGVAVPRALRKMLRAAPDRKPVDEVLVVERARQPRLPAAQASMAKGARTVLDEIRPALVRLGVEVKTVVVPEDDED